MKITFSENEYSSGVTFTPETANETAQLLRMVHNSKAEKPDLYFSFSGNDPWASIEIKKSKGNNTVGAFSNNKTR